MSVKFFAPYHGHSEADGHFGLGKIKMRQQALNGPILSPEQIFQAFAALKNTDVCNISVLQNTKNVAPLENQIRKWFEFKFGGGKCWSREKAGVGGFELNLVLTKEEKKELKVQQKKEQKEQKEEKKRQEKANNQLKKEMKKQRKLMEKEEKKNKVQQNRSRVVRSLKK